MTIAELYDHLEDIGLPLTYYDWATYETIPDPPYIAYMFTSADDFMADNINYQEISNFQVELYTNKKDLVSEKKIEDKFKALETPYTKMETKIEKEGMYQVVYEIQLI